MSEQTKSKDRIPKESLDEHDAIGSWQLPSMQGGDKVVRSAQRDKDEKQKGKVEIETLKANKKPRPLTADELQKITEDARREGFQQGLREGTEQGIREGTKAGEKAGNQRAYLEAKKEIEASQNQLRNLIKRLFEPMQQQDHELENILVDLVLQLSKTIVAAEIKTDPQLILNIVESTLQSLPKGAKHIRVSLSPEDAELVNTLIPENQRDWQVISEAKLDSGGCSIETESSLADFSVADRISGYLEKIAGLEPESILSPVPDYHPEKKDEEVLHTNIPGDHAEPERLSDLESSDENNDKVKNVPSQNSSHSDKED